MRLVTAREELFLATARVVADKAVATASLFTFERADAAPIEFIVTNAHVVDGCRSIDIFLMQADAMGKPLLGSPYICSTTRLGLQWHTHPNSTVDVAVADFEAVNREMDTLGITLANRWLMPKHAYDDQPFEIPEGAESLVEIFGVEVDAIEEVLFVGYPSGYYDRRNHLPIIRRGTTATSPFGDFNGEPAFLIDAPVLPGSSGSPVFIVDTARAAHRWYKRFLFMGIIAEFLPFKELGKFPREVVSEADRLNLLTGLGLVYKPQAIRETIESYLALRTTGA
jgi:hypothetical protein